MRDDMSSIHSYVLFCVMSLLLCFSNAPAARSETRPSDLWKQMLRDLPELRSGDALVKAKVIEASAARGMLLPRITARLEFSRSQGKGPGETSSRDYLESNQLNLEQPILNLGMMDQIKISSLDAEIEQSSHDLKKEQLRLELFKSYFDLVRVDEILSILQRELGELDALESQGQQTIDAGIRRAEDINPYRLQIANFRIRKLQLESYREQSREEIYLLTGQGDLQLAKRNQDYAPEIPRFGQGVQLSMEKIQRLNLQRQKLAKSAAESNFYPTVNLLGSYAHRSVDSLGNEARRRQESYIAIGVNIPVFSGLTDFHYLQAGAQRTLAAQDELQAVENYIATKRSSSEGRLSKSLERYQASQQLLRTAESHLSDSRTKQAEGLLSFDSMIAPRLQALEFKIANLDALYAYFGLYLEAMFIEGRMDEQSLIDFERSVLALQ